VTSKAATIALLLSTSMLSTFCDPNTAANHKASRTAQENVGVSHVPQAGAEQSLICTPVLELRQVNDFLRHHGIPIALSSTVGVPAAAPGRSGQGGIAVCYISGLPQGARE
jgi:hypothetical protein